MRRIVLHGGVISRSGAGVVLVGATGAGKSTLTAFTWQQGWTIGGDDGAVVELSDPPRAEPTYATVRLSEASIEMLGIDPESGSPITGKIRIAGQGDLAFRQESVDLALIAIVEPVEALDEVGFRQLDPIAAHAELFGSTFHADLKRDGTLPALLDGLAVLIGAIPVGILTVPRGREGLVAAESVLRGLVEGRGT